MADAADEFLAHFGVPGMKWGKRNAQTDSDNTDTSSDKYAGLKKGVAIAGGVAVTAGAAFLVYKALKSGKVPPLSAMPTHPSTNMGRSLLEGMNTNVPVPRHNPAQVADQFRRIQREQEALNANLRRQMSRM